MPPAFPAGSPYCTYAPWEIPIPGFPRGAVLGVICHFSPKNYGRKIDEYYRICFRYHKPFASANFRIAIVYLPLLVLNGLLGRFFRIYLKKINDIKIR